MNELEELASPEERRRDYRPPTLPRPNITVIPFMGRIGRIPLTADFIFRIREALFFSKGKKVYRIILSIAWQAKNRKWVTRRQRDLIHYWAGKNGANLSKLPDGAKRIRFEKSPPYNPNRDDELRL